jgi:hypothetical protein
MGPFIIRTIFSPTAKILLLSWFRIHQVINGIISRSSRHLWADRPRGASLRLEGTHDRNKRLIVSTKQNTPLRYQWNCLSMALCWTSANYPVSWSFTQSLGLLGRGIGPSQGRYLHTGQHQHSINSDIRAASGILNHGPSVWADLDRAATVIGLPVKLPTKILYIPPVTEAHVRARQRVGSRTVWKLKRLAVKRAKTY